MSRGAFAAVAFGAVAFLVASPFLIRASADWLMPDTYDVAVLTYRVVGILAAVGAMAALPWSLALRARFRRLERQAVWGWLPLTAWLAGAGLLALSGTLQALTYGPFDSPEDADAVAHWSTWSDVAGFASIAMLAVSLLGGLILSGIALKRDPRSVVDAFD